MPPSAGAADRRVERGCLGSKSDSSRCPAAARPVLSSVPRHVAWDLAAHRSRAPGAEVVPGGATPGLGLAPFRSASLAAGRGDSAGGKSPPLRGPTIRPMTVRWYSIVVDCRDPAAAARWWGDVLGWEIVYEAEDEVVLAPQLDGPRHLPPEAQSPGLVFVPVPEHKSAKNRLHIDVTPTGGASQAAEVDRLIGLGARRVDVGQDESAVPWVVLADPEGNEFCVLSPRD